MRKHLFGSLWIVILSTLYTSCCYNQMDFNSEKWQAVSNLELSKVHSIRQSMVTDLESKLNSKLDNQEAYNLLGIPDASGNWSQQDTIMSYVLGSASLLGVDIEYLQITFNKDGKYIKHEIRKS